MKEEEQEEVEEEQEEQQEQVGSTFINPTFMSEWWEHVFCPDLTTESQPQNCTAHY